MRDENKFLFLCDSVQKFLAEFNDHTKVARVAILKLDHLYYKSDTLYAKIKECPDGKESFIIDNDSKGYINDLVNIINNHGTAKMKLRAALYQIYHLSIHKRFHEARDLLLKTHIVDVIHLQDIGS